MNTNHKFTGLLAALPISTFCFLLSALGLIAPAAHAATITWGSATTISADTDVSTTGLRLCAYCWGPGATVNGVTFTATTSTTTVGADLTLAFPASVGQSSTTFGASGTPYNNLTANYQNIIKGGAYGGTSAGTVTLNKLVVGRSYTVQIWVHDGRGTGAAGTSTRYLTLAGTGTPTLYYYAGGITTSSPGGVGQYAIGTFTADATTQTITMTPGGGTSASVQINAIQVRDTTGSTDGTWNTSTSAQNWSTAGNWLNSIIANDVVATADFSKVNITTDPTVVNLDSSRTIGNLIFGDTVTSSAASWSLTGNTLTLSAATPTITVNTLGASKFAQVSSILAGSFGLTKAGAGELKLVPASVETFTGGLAVNQGQLTVNWGSAPSTANLINSGNALTLGGGALSLQANSSQTGQSQTFASTTLNAGANVIGLNAGGSTTFPVTLGAVTRNPGSTLNISLTHDGTKNIASSSWTSSVNPISDSGVAYATLYTGASTGYPPAGGDDWAAWNGTRAVAPTYTANTSTTLSGNADINATGNTSTTLATGATITSLRFSQAAARTVTITSGSLVTGGILVGSGVGNNLSTITGGTLKSAATAANKDLVIINNDTSSGLTISSIIADVTTGATGLTKSGAGLLTLGTTANTYTGPTYINAGTVSIGSDSTTTGAASPLGKVPSSVTAGNIVLNGGTLSTAGATAATTIHANRGMTLGANGGTLLNPTAQTITYSGTIVGSGALTWTNSSNGGWSIGGQSTYSGGTTLGGSSGLFYVLSSSAGLAGIPSSGPFGVGTLNLAGAQLRSTSGSSQSVGNPVIISANTTFPSVGSEKSLTFSGPVTISGGNRTLTANVGATVTTESVIFSGAIGDGGGGYGLTQAGTGKLILAGANTYTGPTVINSGGTLQLGNGGTSGSLSTSSAITDNGTLIFNRSDDIVQGTHFANGITGSGKFTKLGAGKLTLNTANSFTGTQTLGGGTLTLAHASAMGAAGVSLNFATDVTTTLELAVDGSVNAYVLTSSSGNSTVGNVVVNRATLDAAVDQTLGAAAFGKSTINFSKGANVNSGTPAVNFTTLTLSAGQAGTTTLAPTDVNVMFSGAGTASGTANAKTLALDGTSMGNSLAGGITDGTATPLSLTKANSSTWTISSANTYTGPTTISGGTLKLGSGGTIPNSPTISVASGAIFDVTTPGFTLAAAQTLTGAGTVSGALTSNGKITPGSSGVGTLSVGSLTVNSGSTLDYEFTAVTGTPNDLVNVTTSGGLTLNSAAINLYVSGGTTPFTVNGTYNLFQYSGTLNGSINNLTIANAQPGKTYIFADTGTYITVTIGDAVTADWANDADGSWANSANWVGGTIPNGATHTANFGGTGSPTFTGLRTVTLDNNKTVGAIGFNSPQGFTLDPGTPAGALTLDNGASAGSLAQSAGSHTVNVAINLPSAGASVSAATTPGLTLNGAISGSSAITKSGAGTVVLGADNSSYSGNTTISAGTLQVGAGSAAGTLGSGSVNNSGALIFNRSDTALNAANTISGAGTAANNGSGTVTLSGASTYTGATLLNSGVLSIASIADTVSSPVGIGTAGGFTFNGGTLRFTGASGSTARILTLTGAGTIDVPSGASFSLNGANAAPSATVATWTGSGGLTKTGLGTLTLGANHSLNNRFAMGSNRGGTLTVNDGVLNITPGQYWTLGQDASTTAAYVQNGGTVTYTPTTASSVYNADATGTTASMTINNGSLNLGANSLYVGNNGTGTLNLGNGSGSTATLSTSKLQKGTGTAYANFNGGKIIATAANTAFMTGLTTASINDYGLTIDDGGFAITVGQALLAGTGTGGLTKLGTGVATLSSGGNTYGGNTAINAGTLDITATGSLPGWDTAGRYSVAGNACLAVYNAVTDENIATMLGTGNFQANALLGFDTTTASRTYPAVSGSLADNGANALGLAKLGGNTLTLTGANNYSGNTYIDAGSLQLDHNSALGNSTSITMSGANSSALVLGNGITAGSGKTVTIKGSGVGGFYGALSTASGNTGTSEWLGNVVIGATASRIGSFAGNLKISGNITDGGNNYQLLVRNNGSLITILSGNNTYGGNAVGTSGGTYIVVGELQVTGGSAIPDNGTVYMATSANATTFHVAGSETIGSLYGGYGSTTVSIDANQTLTLAYGSNSYAGVISGSGTLVVNGASQTNTAASPAFTGNTLISSGTLTLGTGGSLAASTVISVASGATFDVSAVGHTVNSGKTLTGAGSVAGAVTVASGGKVVPGSSVGTLTVSALTLSGGSTLDFELVAPGNNDLVNVTTSGGLTLSGGAINLYQVGTTTPFTGNGTYNLFQYSGTLNGSIANLTVANPQFGKRYTFGTSGGYVTLNIADVPVTYWAVDSNGAWGTGGNWSPSTEPNASGDIANFGGYTGTNFTAPRVISLGAAKTVGTLVFDNAQSFTLNADDGSLALDNGSVAASVTVNQGSHTIAAPVSLNTAGVSLSLATSSALTLNGALSGSGPLAKTGNGTLDLGGLATHSVGAVTLAGGTVQNGTLTATAYDGQSGTVSAILAGTGVGLTKSTVGTLTLSGGNTYSGATTINAGTLTAGSSTAFNGNSSALSMSGTGAFDLGGYNASFPNISASASGNTITTTGAGSGTDTLTFTALANAIAAKVTDNGTRKVALTLTGSGASALDALGNTLNDFSGGLNLGNSIRLSVVDNSAVTGGKFGKGPITIGTASQLYFNAASKTIGNDIIVNDNTGNGSRSGGMRVDTAGNTLSGTITANLAPAMFNCGGGNGAITLTGKVTGPNGLTIGNPNGTTMLLTLNTTANLNDYSGVTSIANSATTLKLAAADQIPNGASRGNLSLVQATSLLDLNGFDETINGLTGAGLVDNVTSGTANTLTVGDGDATGNTFSGVIKNTFGILGLTKIGAGTQTLSGVNAYTGPTTISGGTLTIGGAGQLGSGSYAGTILNNGTLIYNSSVAQSLSGVISGSGVLTQNGPGTLSLYAANLFNGGININAGQLSVGYSAGITTASPLGGNAINLGDTIGTAAATLAFVNNSIPTGTAPITVRNGSAGTKSLQANLSVSAFHNGSITLNDDFTAGGSGNLTLGGIIADGTQGAKGLTKTGSGALTLSGANTFSGGVSMNGGTAGTTLNINHATALGTGTFTITGGNSSIIDCTAAADVLMTANNPMAWNNDFTFTGTKSLNLGSGAVTLGGSRNITNNAKTLTVNGPISASSATYTLNKYGNGTLVLGGDSTFGGNINHNAGTLKLTHSNALGTGSKNFYMQGANRILQLSGGITLDNNIAMTLSSNSGDGTGVANVDGDNEIRGKISISTGNPSLNISSTAGSLKITNSVTLVTSGRPLYLGGASTGDNIISGVIGETGGALPVTKQGAGTWILSGANTYTGPTTINGGTLKVGHATALGGTFATASVNQLPVLVGSSGTLDLNGQTFNSRPLTLNGGSLVNNGTSLATLNAAGAGLGTVAFTNGGSGISAGATLSINGGGGSDATATASLGITVQSVSSITGGTGYKVNDVLNLTGGGGTGASIKISAVDGAGNPTTWTVNAAGSGFTAAPTGFTPGTGVTGTGATLTFSGDNFTVVSTTVTAAGSGYTSQPTVAISSGTGFAAQAILNNSLYLSANSTIKGSGDMTISRIVDGIGSLTKSEAGTLTLSGVNTYSGGTTNSGGTLLVNNPTGSGTGSGTVTVDGGILGGSGSISGAVTVNSGGTLWAGTGAGSLGTLTLGAAPTLNGKVWAELYKGNTPAADKLVLSTGTLTYAGTLVVSNNPASPALVNGDTFTLFNAPAYSGWFSSVSLPTLPTGLTWDTNRVAAEGVLEVYNFRTNAVQTMVALKGTATTLKITKLTGKTENARGLVGVLGVSSTNGATVGISGPDITYTPPNGFTGTDTFTAVLSDGHGSITATVVVTVSDANAGLSLTPQIVDGKGSFTASGLPNTTYVVEVATNVNGPWTTAQNGTVTAAANGFITYTDTKLITEYGNPVFYRLKQQ